MKVTSLLARTDLGPLVDLVSPKFFDVLPARLLWREGRRLLRNYRDAEGFAAARRRRREALADSELSVRLDDGSGVESTMPSDPVDYAERVVTLYFHQLFADAPVILDLRDRALHESDGGLLWQPGAMWTELEPDFLAAIREIYVGFYRDEPDRFEAGLEALNLAGAGPLFERHFGEDVQATRFETASFVSTFHDIFSYCGREGIELAGGFLGFGVYLATMYDNLDRLDVEVDVRSCFLRATRDR